MRIIILQLLLSAVLAMPHVPVSCGGKSSCCKMKTTHLQHHGSEISQRVCCCGIGDCSSKRGPLAVAALIHQGDPSSINASVVLLPLFPGTEEKNFSPGILPLQKRGYEGGSLFIARLLCVFRC